MNLAVGIDYRDGGDYKVIVVADGTTISMSEDTARKIADDILRNADYLRSSREDGKNDE